MNSKSILESVLRVPLLIAFDSYLRGEIPEFPRGESWPPTNSLGIFVTKTFYCCIHVIGLYLLMVTLENLPTKHIRLFYRHAAPYLVLYMSYSFYKRSPVAPSSLENESEKFVYLLNDSSLEPPEISNLLGTTLLNCALNLNSSLWLVMAVQLSLYAAFLFSLKKIYRVSESKKITFRKTALICALFILPGVMKTSTNWKITADILSILAYLSCLGFCISPSVMVDFVRENVGLIDYGIVLQNPMDKSFLTLLLFLSVRFGLSISCDPVSSYGELMMCVSNTLSKLIECHVTQFAVFTVFLKGRQFLLKTYYNVCETPLISQPSSAQNLRMDSFVLIFFPFWLYYSLLFENGNDAYIYMYNVFKFYLYWILYSINGFQDVLHNQMLQQLNAALNQEDNASSVCIRAVKLSLIGPCSSLLILCIMYFYIVTEEGSVILFLAIDAACTGLGKTISFIVKVLVQTYYVEEVNEDQFPDGLNLEESLQSITIAVEHWYNMLLMLLFVIIVYARRSYPSQSNPILLALLDSAIFYVYHMNAENTGRQAIAFRIKVDQIKLLYARLPKATAMQLAAYNDVCAVCHKEMTENATRILRCGHIFHWACIKTAVLINQFKCPLCSVVIQV